MINIHADRVDTGTSTFPGNLSGTNGAWDLEEFKKEMDMEIHKMGPLEANFDLKGVDVSLANAFRRIMIAEVPSVAVEKVFIEMNTSVIHDEILAQRIGLVPIGMSPDNIDWLDPAIEGNEEPTYDTGNCVMFKLSVKCEHNPNAAEGETDPDKLYINHKVYARDLQYVHDEEQFTERLKNVTPKALNPDILLAKLRPGQEITLSALVILGIGSDHAKFSPVCTASYRLMPTITITEPIEPQDVDKFVKCFPPGVIEVKDKKPVVANPRKDTVSREVLRHPEFKDKVKLGRVRDHFIFNVESTGTMEPDEIFVKSINILRLKAKGLLDCEF